MDVLCSKIRNITIYFFIFYFITIVAGVLDGEPEGVEEDVDDPMLELQEYDDDPMYESEVDDPNIELYEYGQPPKSSEFNSLGQENCWIHIHEVFSMAFELSDRNKSYLHLAVQYMRLPREHEINEYRETLAPEHRENDQYFKYLLYNERGKSPFVENNKFAFKYYKFISNKFTVGNTISPIVYCGAVYDCNHALRYFRFQIDIDTQAAIKHAISNLVLSDIRANSNFRNDMTEPSDTNHAFMYLLHIASKLESNDEINKSPYEFCLDPANVVEIPI